MGRELHLYCMGARKLSTAHAYGDAFLLYRRATGFFPQAAQV